MSLPLLARPNSVIAMGAQDERPDYDYAEGVTLRIYALEGGKSVTVEIPTVRCEIETTFTMQREGQRIMVERNGGAKAWRVLLVGIPSIAAAEGGTAENGPQGVLVTCTADTDALQIVLP